MTAFETWTGIAVTQLSVPCVAVHAGKKKESYDLSGSSPDSVSQVEVLADDEITFFNADGSIGDGLCVPVAVQRHLKALDTCISRSPGDGTVLIPEHASNDSNCVNRTNWV